MQVLESGTDETGIRIEIYDDIVDICSWNDYEITHTETITLERFKKHLGI